MLSKVEAAQGQQAHKRDEAPSEARKWGESEARKWGEGYTFLSIKGRERGGGARSTEQTSLHIPQPLRPAHEATGARKVQPTALAFQSDPLARVRPCALSALTLKP